VILLETSLLSVAFRHRRPAESEPAPVMLLRGLVHENASLGIPGIVLQEVLTGLREDRQASQVRQALTGFPVVLATEGDHRLAVGILEASRKAGKAVSTVDGLIAAMAIARQATLFTLDRDFTRIPTSCGLRLFKV